MPQLQTDVTPANRRAVTSRYEIVAELKLTKQNKANRPTSLDTTRRITTESCVAKLMQHSRMDSHVSLHRSCKTLAALPSRHCQRTQTLTQNILLWRGPCEVQSKHTQVYSSLSLSLALPLYWATRWRGWTFQDRPTNSAFEHCPPHPHGTANGAAQHGHALAAASGTSSHLPSTSRHKRRTREEGDQSTSRTHVNSDLNCVAATRCLIYKSEMRCCYAMPDLHSHACATQSHQNQ